MYQCPMKCDNGKKYDKQGNCPICGMNLIHVDHEHKQSEHHDHNHKHEDVKEHLSHSHHEHNHSDCICHDESCDGSCKTNCQCTFYAAELSKPTFEAKKTNSTKAYICPMRCEGGDKTYPNPGSCPVCGMHMTEVISFGSEIDLEDDDGVKAYKQMRFRLIWSAILSLPIFILAMGELIPGIDKIIEGLFSRQVNLYVQLVLSLPVMVIFFQDSFLLIVLKVLRIKI